MAKKSSIVPGEISEEFYQISIEIYMSFPKYRPPVSLFQFKENIPTLYPFSKKDQRLTNEQIETAIELCKEGNLFVSRTDLPIYAEHIVHQLDLILLDKNFKANEVAEIIIKALTKKYQDFIEQPIKIVYDELYSDIMVFTEYVWEDIYRLRGFLGRLYTGEHDFRYHAVNTLVLGLWIFSELQKEKNRKMFDKVALGLYLHDIGMGKISPFIINKKTPLTKEEIEKNKTHTIAGVKMLQRVDVAEKEVLQAVFEHHERLDGSGYPQKLCQPLSVIARITAVADSISAMIQERPYAKKIDIKTAIASVCNDRSKYDNNVATVLLNGLVSGYFDKLLPAK